MGYGGATREKEPESLSSLRSHPLAWSAASTFPLRKRKANFYFISAPVALISQSLQDDPNPEHCTDTLPGESSRTFFGDYHLINETIPWSVGI